MKISTQVSDALKSLHPGVRKDIKRALSDLDEGKKRDTRALDKELTGFHRLRIGKYRVIYWRNSTGELVAEFLDLRDTIYERFKP